MRYATEDAGQLDSSVDAGPTNRVDAGDADPTSDGPSSDAAEAGADAEAEAAAGPAPPALGTAATFAVLAGSTVTNTGASSFVGDLGVAPGTAVTGVTAAMVSGSLHADDGAAIQAQKDVTTAYNELRSKACGGDLTGADLGNRTLTPGVYCFPASGAHFSGTLLLDAQGDPGAIFVFQIAQELMTTANCRVRVINGGLECNVFWQVGTSATVGSGSIFAGNILASASITLSAGVLLAGRALARSAAVTIDSTDVSKPGCTPK